MPKQYRSKRVLIEAMQNTKEQHDELVKWIGAAFVERTWDPISVAMNSGHGVAVCSKGDWVVKDPDGRFYPVADSVFTEKYESVPAPVK